MGSKGPGEACGSGPASSSSRVFRAPLVARLCRRDADEFRRPIYLHGLRIGEEVVRVGHDGLRARLLDFVARDVIEVSEWIEALVSDHGHARVKATDHLQLPDLFDGRDDELIVDLEHLRRLRAVLDRVALEEPRPCGPSYSSAAG